MPFTFAHPAILLPFRNKLSVTGLIIGCMSPDFEYFIRLKIYSNFSHTFWGIFFFCLPVSLVLSILFHQIIRKPLIENAPNYVYSRVAVYHDFSWMNYLNNNKIKIILSILIGAFSHILWDSFTHDDGFFVNQLDFLKSNLTIHQKEIPVLKVLQHLSTIIGLSYMLILFHRLPKLHKPKNRIGLRYFFIILILTICFILPLIQINPNTLKIGNLIVCSISCTFISIVITSIFIKKKQP